MEENLRELSKRLSEASSLLTTVLDSGQLSSESRSVQNIRTNDTTHSSTTSTARISHSLSGTSRSRETSVSTNPPSGNGLSNAIGHRIGSAVARARSMITSSSSGGLYSRLSRRERLRASSPSSQLNNKRSKQEAAPLKKVFEFVLVNVCAESESWIINDENVALRGLIEITTASNEAEIRSEIGKATRIKFPMVSDSDFEFLRASRRKLSKPVNCRAFDYQQVKLLAGQGSIYIKVKDGLDCLFIDESSLNEVDEEGMFFQIDNADLLMFIMFEASVVYVGGMAGCLGYTLLTYSLI